MVNGRKYVFQGRKFQSVSVHDVDAGDTIKVGSRLVEIAEVSFSREQSGKVKDWVVRGRDGRAYSMFDVNLYLKAS